MMPINPKSSWRIGLARLIAVTADIVQLAIFPWVIEGAASPVDDVLDVVVAALLTLLVGWHIAFLPSFIVKLIPFADLAPTWTVAIFVATRGKNAQPALEVKEETNSR
jgi:hypothetical protein